MDFTILVLLILFNSGGIESSDQGSKFVATRFPIADITNFGSLCSDYSFEYNNLTSEYIQFWQAPSTGGLGKPIGPPQIIPSHQGIMSTSCKHDQFLIASPSLFDNWQTMSSTVVGWSKPWGGSATECTNGFSSYHSFFPPFNYLTDSFFISGGTLPLDGYPFCPCRIVVLRISPGKPCPIPSHDEYCFKKFSGILLREMTGLVAQDSLIVFSAITVLSQPVIMAITPSLEIINLPPLFFGINKILSVAIHPSGLQFAVVVSVTTDFFPLEIYVFNRNSTSSTTFNYPTSIQTTRPASAGKLFYMSDLLIWSTSIYDPIRVDFFQVDKFQVRYDFSQPYRVIDARNNSLLIMAYPTVPVIIIPSSPGYQWDMTLYQPVKCPLGMAKNETSFASCSPCPYDTYVTSTGSKICLPCPAAHICTWGSWQPLLKSRLTNITSNSANGTKAEQFELPKEQNKEGLEERTVLTFFGEKLSIYIVITVFLESSLFMIIVAIILVLRNSSRPSSTPVDKYCEFLGICSKCLSGRIDHDKDDDHRLPFDPRRRRIKSYPHLADCCRIWWGVGIMTLGIWAVIIGGFFFFSYGQYVDYTKPLPDHAVFPINVDRTSEQVPIFNSRTLLKTIPFDLETHNITLQLSLMGFIGKCSSDLASINWLSGAETVPGTVRKTFQAGQKPYSICNITISQVATFDQRAILEIILAGVSLNSTYYEAVYWSLITPAVQSGKIVNLTLTDSTWWGPDDYDPTYGPNIKQRSWTVAKHFILTQTQSSNIFTTGEDLQTDAWITLQTTSRYYQVRYGTGITMEIDITADQFLLHNKQIREFDLISFGVGFILAWIALSHAIVVPLIIVHCGSKWVKRARHMVQNPAYINTEYSNITGTPSDTPLTVYKSYHSNDHHFNSGQEPFPADRSEDDQLTDLRFTDDNPDSDQSEEFQLGELESSGDSQIDPAAGIYDIDSNNDQKPEVDAKDETLEIDSEIGIENSPNNDQNLRIDSDNTNS